MLSDSIFNGIRNVKWEVLPLSNKREAVPSKTRFLASNLECKLKTISPTVYTTRINK